LNIRYTFVNLCTFWCIFIRVFLIQFFFNVTFLYVSFYLYFYEGNSIVKAPGYLTICINSKFNGEDYTVGSSKPNKLVILSDDLDMREFCDDGNVNDVIKYDLLAVVDYAGSGESGHYTTSCKVEGGWYTFNDDQVTLVEKERVNNVNNYLLLYKRHDDAKDKPEGSGSDMEVETNL
jgi:hypothetical protein